MTDLRKVRPFLNFPVIVLLNELLLKAMLFEIMSKLPKKTQKKHKKGQKKMEIT